VLDPTYLIIQTGLAFSEEKLQATKLLTVQLSPPFCHLLFVGGVQIPSSALAQKSQQNYSFVYFNFFNRTRKGQRFRAELYKEFSKLVLRLISSEICRILLSYRDAQILELQKFKRFVGYLYDDSVLYSCDFRAY
jgi:hypothetical protein